MRTTEMENFLYERYMGYICYWLNDGLIRYWVAPPKRKSRKARSQFEQNQAQL